jgi:uric acid transporter
VDFTAQPHNLFVVAVSVGFGMIPLMATNFFGAMPDFLHPLLESGILLASVVSVLLNAFFNGLSGFEQAASEAARRNPVGLGLGSTNERICKNVACFADQSP